MCSIQLTLFVVVHLNQPYIVFGETPYFSATETADSPALTLDKISSLTSLETVDFKCFHPLKSVINYTDTECILRGTGQEDNGSLECHQIYASGLIYSSEDVLRVGDGKKTIYLQNIVSKLFQVLKAASNFYQMVGYNGGLEGYVEVQGTEDVRLMSFQSQMFFNEIRALMPSYRLDFSDLDTAKISDPIEFQKLYINFVKDLFWSFGYQDLHEDIIKNYLRANQWLIE